MFCAMHTFVLVLILLGPGCSVSAVQTEVVLQTLQNAKHNVSLVCRDGINHNLVSNAVWRRDELVNLTESSFHSPVQLGSGKITFMVPLLPSSIRPEDEGRYSCRTASSQSEFGPAKEFQVYPYADQKLRNVTQKQGGTLTVQCGVTIGTISREQQHEVTWKMQRKGGHPLILFTYDSEDADSEPTSEAYYFNTTDFSLKFFNYNEANVTTYTCRVKTNVKGTSIYYGEKAKTSVSLEECAKPQILDSLPDVIIVQPGEHQNVNLTFRSTSVPTVTWTLNGHTLSDGTELHMQPNATFTAVLTVGEQHGGKLSATVQDCGSIVLNTTVITVELAEAQLTQKSSCDQATLSVSLTQELPDDLKLDLKLIVRFVAIGKDDKQVATQNYSIVEASGISNISDLVLGEFPGFVGEYTVEVQLAVNGIVSSNWVIANGNASTCTMDSSYMELMLSFEKTCLDIEVSAVTEALEGSLNAWCSENRASCTGVVEFVEDTASLKCETTTATFTVEVRVSEADAVVENYYSYLKSEEVDVEVGGQSIEVQCSCNEDTEKPDSEKDWSFLMFLLLVLVMAVMVVVLVVLLLFFIGYRSCRPPKIICPEHRGTPGTYQRPPSPCPMPGTYQLPPSPYPVPIPVIPHPPPSPLCPTDPHPQPTVVYVPPNPNGVFLLVPHSPSPSVCHSPRTTPPPSPPPQEQEEHRGFISLAELNNTNRVYSSDTSLNGPVLFTQQAVAGYTHSFPMIPAFCQVPSAFRLVQRNPARCQSASNIHYDSGVGASENSSHTESPSFNNRHSSNSEQLFVPSRAPPQTASADQTMERPGRPQFQRMRSSSCPNVDNCAMTPNSQRLLRSLSYEDDSDYRTGLFLMRIQSIAAGEPELEDQPW